jgi:hypothetical protein
MHPNDEIVTIQEGAYPRCPYCHLFTPSVGPKHLQLQPVKTKLLELKNANG